MNSTEQLSVIYRLYCDRGGARSTLVERLLNIETDVSVTADDQRNEADCYKALYVGSYDSLLTQLHDYLMTSMRGREIDDCDDSFVGLRFLTGITMKAVMLHNANRTTPLAMFANEFDRLDRPEERRRLHARAQARPA
jgi:hypothetical protein